MSVTLQAALEAALASSDLERALTVAREICVDPTANAAQAHTLAGKLSLALGRDADARGHLERAVSLDTPDPDAWGRLALLLGDGDRALELALKARELGCLASWLTGYLGHLMLNVADRPADAIDAFHQALATESRPPQRAHLLGQLATSAVSARLEQPLTDALDALLGAADIPDAVLEQTLEAAVSWEEQQIVPLACHQLIGRLLERHTTTATAGRAPALLRAARHHRCHHRLDRALELVEAAETEEPGREDTARMLAGIHLLAGRVELAEPLIMRPAPGVTFPPEVYLGLAEVLVRQDDLERAISAVERAVELVPTHAGAWIELARLRAAAGRDDEAEQALRRAVSFDPEIDRESGKARENLRLFTTKVAGIVAAASPVALHGIERVRFGHNAMVARLRLDSGALAYLKAFLPGRRSAKHVHSTGQLMALLPAMDGIETPTPLADPSGTYSHSWGRGPALLMTATRGAPLRRAHASPRRTMSASHARSIGDALAAFHGAAASLTQWRRTDDGGMGSGLLLLTDWARADAPVDFLVNRFGLADHRAEVAAVVDRLAPTIGAAAAAVATLTKGVIHGDFGWHNVLWDDAGTVVGMIDFDYAAVDVPLADLLNAVHRTAFDWSRLVSHGNPLYRPELAAGLVAGYRARGGHVPSADDLAVLFPFGRVHYFFAMASAASDDRDERTNRSYNNAADSLRLLAAQLDWLLPQADTARTW